MSESASQTKTAFLAVGAVSLLAAAFYAIKARKRRQIVESTEKYFRPRNTSWMQLPRARANSAEGEDIFDPQQHPADAANIDNKDDGSWLKKDKQLPAKTDLLHTGHIKGGKLLVVMVGLPGRGKTYIARKVARYLRWISYRTRAFSLAKYRLDKVGSKSAEFFDPKVSSNYVQRVELIKIALEDAMRYLHRGGEIAILDGTNTTRDRRKLIYDRVKQEDGYDILWIESIRDEDNLDISEEQWEQLKLSPDFIDRLDYEKKFHFYKQSYETLNDEEGSFIKVYDDGKKLTLHAIYGFLRTKIVSFVMNLHQVPRPVYIVRHGESYFNLRGLIGGDSGLTLKGLSFSRALNAYLSEEMENLRVTNNNDGSTSVYSLKSPEDKNGDGAAAKSTEGGKNNTMKKYLNVWSSTMRRARESASEIDCKRYVEWRALREIETGVCDGLTYEQVKLKFPDEYRSRSADKLRYRYPRGESYLDVITRLEPVIFELERQQEPILIIAHQAVLRCLYAYFLDLPVEEIPYLSIPLHTLIKLESKAYGCKEKRMRIVVNDGTENNQKE